MFIIISGSYWYDLVLFIILLLLDNLYICHGSGGSKMFYVLCLSNGGVNSTIDRTLSSYYSELNKCVDYCRILTRCHDSLSAARRSVYKGKETQYLIHHWHKVRSVTLSIYL